MKIYLYDEVTGVYKGEKEAVVDEFTSACKGEIVYWLEACATFTEPVFQENYTTVWNTQTQEWDLVPPPSQEEIQKMLTDGVQAYMDNTAQTRGYDNIHTACSYAYSTDAIFAKEGKACLEWRDKVWRTCYDILAQVLGGLREIPTLEEVIAELPAFNWGDEVEEAK